MDFAPYQASPEETRALSPPPRTSTSSPRQSISPIRRSFSPGVRSPAFLQSTSNAAAKNGNFAPSTTPNPWAQRERERDGYFPTVNTGNGYQDVESGRVGGGYNVGGSVSGGAGYGGGSRDGLHEFETSLPLRLDYEACLAYLLLPPAGGVLLLVLERKSDYVRFHAWQSALLFTAMFVVHLMFSWSKSSLVCSETRKNFSIDKSKPYGLSVGIDVRLRPVYVMVIAPRRHQFDSMANQESISRCGYSRPMRSPSFWKSS
ncbi:hypothetical protein BCIN_11g02300 [Botrytis cinerea B05.10]|uniref:Uncharacterized protein n=1 Tax=Botryotinia fuckeliana (strain B05.10) TaxID=332648 RepID=A0A384JWF1_BOTFB|nr:hypothetical protein BCIN_11g02300 [Botrytis cinerea B05.10]ATZ54915.1 hypothetical protein BCIN_11g02300 [Botrytis cinerea B05.10]